MSEKEFENRNQEIELEEELQMQNVSASNSRSEHHHHSHHHSRHHSHSKHSSKRSKGRFWRRLKRNKRKWLLVLGILLFAIALGLLAYIVDKGLFFPQDGDNDSSSNVSVSAKVEIRVPVFTEDFTLVNQAAMELFNAEQQINLNDFYKKHVKDARLDVGLPVRLSYELVGDSAKLYVQSTKYEISESAEYTDPRVVVHNSAKDFLDVYHLKTNTQYYYRLTITFSNDQSTVVSGTFKTADTPRILSIDGIANVRDIGGYVTDSGQRIKQGYLYRGTEMDGSVQAEYAITATGMNDMLTTLKIKTEMDLRSESVISGVETLGPTIKHQFYDVKMYSGCFEEDGKEAYRRVFSDLADESNYPIYMHCTYGLDRTGTVCYLLGALLGVDEDTLLKEYQLSALHLGGVNQERLSEFIGHLKTYDGATLKEKAEDYLLSIGVTAEEITSIRTIFLQ